MYSPQKTRVGILGGGQLARMMVLAAHNLGLQTWVMSEEKDDPAAQVTAFWLKGDVNRPSDISNLLKRVDVATVESEFLNSGTLQTTSKKNRTPIYPLPKILGDIQDRFSQKLLLKQADIPTLACIPVSTNTHLDLAIQLFSLPLVLKKRRFGYDGYGTFILKTKSDVKKFTKNNLADPHGFIAEPWIKFRRELAVSIARNKKGQVVTLPLVETKQSNSICHWVKGPIKNKSFDQLSQKLQKFVSEIKYVGVLAFEMFDTPFGIAINELAPRVHNSAHYSQDALEVSQFEYHLRAILNMELPRPQLLAPGFAMINLLGKGKKSVQLSTKADARIHWYGKAENRKGRKMGHLNSLSNNPEKALEIAKASERNCSL